MTANEFNDWYQPGHPVWVVEDDGTETQSCTRSKAWELGHGTPVVLVEGRVGGVHLDRVKAMETHHG